MKRFCGSCGTKAGPTNKFCAGCGAALRMSQTVDATVVRSDDRLPGDRWQAPLADPAAVAPVPVAPVPVAPVPVAPVPVAPAPQAPAAGSATTPPPLPPLPRAVAGAGGGWAPAPRPSQGRRADGGRTAIEADRSSLLGARLPVTDLIRDVAASAAALAALTIAWDASHRGAGRWWVVVAVLLLVASLAVSYLHRFGVAGSLPAKQVRWIVAGANVPAILSILVAVVDTVVRVVVGEPAGLGGGVILLTAAAVLALSPRAGEPISAHASSWWGLVTRGLGIVALGVAALTTVLHLLYDDVAWSVPAVTIFVVLYLLGSLVALFALPWAQGLRGSFAGLVIVMVVGATIAVTQVLAAASQVFGSQLARPEEPVAMCSFLVVATAAAFASRPMLARVKREDAVAEWVGLARLALLLAAVGAALQVMLRIAVTSLVGLWTVSQVVVVVLTFAVVALSASCVAILAQDAGRGRAATVLGASSMVVVGIVTIAVAARSGPGQVIDWSTVSSLVVLPLVAVGALVAPADVRQRFGPLLTPQGETHVAQERP